MRCPQISELPPAPPGKTGWPWDQDSSARLPAQPSGHPYPCISIVTPSFNQGQFLEETIRSVLLQGYPNLEYMVIDGGSNDNSIEIIKKYEPWLTCWVSEKDRGQSHAINKGWQRATGDLLAWLCSDDVYTPGALARVAALWMRAPEAVAIVGAVQSTDEQSRPLGPPNRPSLPNSGPLDLTLIDHEKWFLPQPSGFWSRQALDHVGRRIREDLHYTMDREVYYRLCMQGRTILLNQTLATYRFHESSKSVSAILKQHGEAPKALAYCTWGGSEAERRRKKVATWRVAQGHYRFARSISQKTVKGRHLLLAARYRPGYLRRKAFYVVLLEALGVMKPSRLLWRSILRSVASAH